VIDNVLPKQQAGFHLGRLCCEQVKAITIFIESGFQKKLKTAAVFIDLTAAYDTVWREGLLLKFSKIIPCSKLNKLLNTVLINRIIRVHIKDSQSSWRNINNGLPQGFILAPILFNLHIYDIPENLLSHRFQYADDTALAVQNTDFKTCEDKLNEDLNTLLKYYKMWKLKPNPSKTDSIMFHLRLANQKLNINLDEIQVRHNIALKYLGVNLDRSRSLTYIVHLERIALKLSTRNNIITELAGTGWGANANYLRTATLAFVYSTATFG